ncbi:MAG: 4a-hydroxytetrahydrobiopterin dehydratase [Oligoflexia bacterium]|nr:4a-hydroxytetrahydrobiopterin dehydratase [Oligoflexia bacterium]
MPLKKLPSQEVDERLNQCSGWKRQGDEIVKTFIFQSFEKSIEFVNRLAVEAEKMNHHPDIDIRYNKVSLLLTTHDSNGLTENDLSLAKKANELA